MAWCIPVPAEWTGNADPLSLQYAVFGNGYTGNASGQISGQNLPAAFVSLVNDQDRLTPYLWSLVDGPEGQCICVETSDPVAAPLPASIRWLVAGGVGTVTDFAEIEKGEDKKSIADQCFLILFGCTFTELFTLCLAKLTGQRQAEFTSVASATFTGDANNTGELMQLTQTRADAGLTVAGTTITNTIGGNHAIVDFSAFIDEPVDGTEQRITPSLELLKNGTPVLTAATGYLRQVSGHDETSLPGIYTDEGPAAGDTWQLRALQGANNTGETPVDLTHFSIRVVERFPVLTL